MDTIIRRNPVNAIELQPKYRNYTEELVTVFFSRIFKLDILLIVGLLYS